MDREATAARVKARLEIIDALIWATDHADEVVSIVQSTASSSEAMRRLTEPPQSFSEFAAHHILDMSFRALSRQNVALLMEERDRLRRGEDTSSDRGQ